MSFGLPSLSSAADAIRHRAPWHVEAWKNAKCCPAGVAVVVVVVVVVVMVVVVVQGAGLARWRDLPQAAG